MHIFTIVAFALTFWRLDNPPNLRIAGSDDVFITLAIAIGPVPVAVAVGWWLSRRSLRTLSMRPHSIHAVQRRHHRRVLALRLFLLAGYGIAILLTPWADWLIPAWLPPPLRIVADLVAMSPFFIGCTALWMVAYRLEMRLRGYALEQLPARRGHWSRQAYTLVFLRNQVLVFAVPLTLILFFANLTNGYSDQLVQATRVSFAPDIALGVCAAGVFLISPVLLRYIWHTEPLKAGPMRDELEAICARIGLRCRDILVWKSDGMVINAAVMGIVSPLRYVLLSDGLLESMSRREVEAVFGHEAGHVRHRHIPLFLLFACVGWLLALGIMELLLRTFAGPEATVRLSANAIQGIAVAATILFWGIGFGWVSRRFERQADLFGARCVALPADRCGLPCSVHPDPFTTIADPHRVCASGAETFVSALDRVAVLNGIPHEEPSWRHSSIANRMRCLVRLASDPLETQRFDRMMLIIQRCLVALTVAGLAIAGAYWVIVGQPAVLG